MKIGILLTGRSTDEMERNHGRYDTLFEALLADRGFEFTTYLVLDNEFPKNVNDADGWLITGSKFGVYEEHEWIPPLENFIRDAYAADVPTIGVCFGHQIIAQALGGTVVKYSGGWSVGAVDYHYVDSGNPAGAPNNNASNNARTKKLKLIAWHQDQIAKLPDDARVVAKSEFCQYAMLAYKDRALTLQPHPEFSAEYTRALLEARRQTLPVEIADAAQNQLEDELSTLQIADQFEAFFKHRLLHKPDTG